jgi:hypothetical protein
MLIAKLSCQTASSKTNVNHVKLNLLYATDYLPILPVFHTFYTIMATLKGVIFHSDNVSNAYCVLQQPA